MSNDVLVSALAMLVPIVTVTVSLGALIVWILMWNRGRRRRRLSHLLFRGGAQGGNLETRSAHVQ